MTSVSRSNAFGDEAKSSPPSNDENAILPSAMDRVAQAQELYRKYVKDDAVADAFLATRERD